MSINWNNIRPLESSQNDGFEELICQLARKEDIANKIKFIRKGKPDAGVECLWILNNNDEFAWQAKFFTNSITDNQWQQIDKSVKVALEKHPNLKKYYIAIPCDPPDARITGQTSMLEKWNSRVKKWEGWASEKGLITEFIPWWSSDLIERLQRPENVGLTYFWFNKEEFTNEWCKEQTQLSISDLGKRYTPELNVKLKITEIFNGISRDSKFENQLENLFDDFLMKGNKIIPSVKDLDSHKIIFKSELDTLLNLFTDVNFFGIQNIAKEEFIKLLENIKETTTDIKEYYLKVENKIQEKLNDYKYYKKYGREISNVKNFEESLYNLIQFFEGTTMKLANHPFLLLEGEAGVGKSHLLADIIEERNRNGLISLFFLGQHFVTNEDPWTQIFKKNDIKCSVKEFLGALNSKAQVSGHRIIIFIDALNEGRGKYFWNNNIRSFLKKIKRYEWLGIVLSVRSSYSELMFPKDEFREDDIIRYTHYGFKNYEYEATKLFFNNYGIELPSVPLLHPEFQNPLFLFLFCDGLNKAGYTKIPDGLQGITSIIDFFIQGVNNILSKPDRLAYPKNINIVKKAIESLIAYKVEKQLRFVSYEQAFLLCNKVSNEYKIMNNGLLDELISEGILSKNLFCFAPKQYDEGVYLAYERFEDHLITSLLIDKNPILEEAFSEKGNLYYLVKDESECTFNKGIIETLSIQIPEKARKELYDFVPHIKDSYTIVECFVQSLLWRKIETITENILEYINSVVLSYKGTEDLFLDTLISISSIPNNFLNANFLHKNLMNHSLADRDSWWTIYLKDQFNEQSAVKRLIDWAWNSNDRSHISDESIILSSITLSWLLTSTNRKLRDSATKALISLLENRVNVLIQLLEKFEEVNDPYVYERLFAVAYGCAVRTEQKDKLTELSQYVFKTIFEDKQEVYPHILLRDYARGVIEFTIHLGYKLGFDISKIRPPYKSEFPKNLPSNEEIDDKYKLDYDAEEFKKYYWAQNDILSSMATEYGRGTGGYGDFGRYTFEFALSNWDVDANKLSNLAVMWIFERYGYDNEKHGRFDRNIGSGRGRDTHPNERIGKKYQWISFYEILARVSDNRKKYADWSYSKAEMETFQGPWEPYVRDIDPTMLITKTGDYDEENPKRYWWNQEDYSNWDLKNEDWTRVVNDLPSSRNLINIKDEKGEEWLILEGNPIWAEPKNIGDDKWNSSHKRIWYQLRSYLVSEKAYEKINDWAKVQDFMGQWMPESVSRYEVFSREYYWSPAYEFFNSEYYGGIEKCRVNDRLSGKLVSEVYLTSNNFLWEEEFDKSKEKVIHFLKPSRYIYENMKISFSKIEGEFVDEEGSLICFDPSVNNSSLSYLLIKKKPFLEFLKQNHLRILWTVIGEKNIVGGSFSRDRFIGRLGISGAYYLDENDNVDGKVITKIT